MKLDHILTPCTKINSKWLQVLNIRHDTIKLLEESIGEAYSDVNCTSVFLGQFPQAIEVKTKIKKWDLIKVTGTCIAKETIKKMERQPTEWEKIFAKKWCNRQRLDLQHMQTAHKTQQQKKTAQSKNGQNTLIDISPKKTIRWPVDTWKDAQHH